MNFYEKTYVCRCDVITFTMERPKVTWLCSTQQSKQFDGSHDLLAWILRKLQLKEVFYKKSHIQVLRLWRRNVMIIRDTIMWFIPLHRPSTLL